METTAGPMADRVVVITGATGNLGPVVAERFAADGARCALLARDEESCIGVAMGLPGGIRRHRGVPVDLADPASALAAADTIREKLGPPHVLLHLVGSYGGGVPIDEFPLEDWQRLIDVNLVSTIHATRAFLADIRAAEHGRIVTMSTPLATAPPTNVAAYAATKAAVESLTMSIARELAGTTATANVILVRTIGSGKPTHTRPEEIAAAMAWLCSPAAGAVNGQRIPLVGRAEAPKTG
jgi:NAD(P)-dependent dehydrogenase (short-subunit alcohol dehydrogenase family)